MAYNEFDPDRPDVAAGGATRKSEIDKARNNLTALADMMAALCGMQGFDLEITASSSDGPTTVEATNGTQVVKKVITYGSGATAGLPVTVVYSKSTNGGSSYDTIATQTINYDGSGDFTDYTWA